MARRYRQRKKSNDQLLFLLVFFSLIILLPLAGSDGSPSVSGIATFLVVILLCGSVVLVYLLYKLSKHRQALRRLDLMAVDLMTGENFERWVGEHLRIRGYHIRFTPINDYGVDIVASKDGVKTAVQVKRYSRPLDQKPVREAVAGMLHYNCTRSMVVTNSSFTRAAKMLAKSNHCELIDRDKLAEWTT